MEMYYYADDQNNPVGPLPLQAMQDLANKGIIRANTKVIEHGGAAWTTWEKIRPTGFTPPPPIGIDPMEKVRQAHTAWTGRVQSETGIGVFSVLYGIFLVLLELLILPYRVLKRAIRDLDSWGKAGVLPIGETDLPILTYQVVVVRALVHVLITLFCLCASVYSLLSPMLNRYTSALESVGGAVAWIFGAYFLNLVVAAFYEIFGIGIRLVNYVKKVADKP